MISVQEVFNILERNAGAMAPQELPLLACLGLVAAEEVTAPVDVPVFDNSAMDGYAIRYEDVEAAIPIHVAHTIVAGAPGLPVLRRGEAARIFTGAPVPEGADTVVQQEICGLKDGSLTFLQPIAAGTHIRKQGTQTRKGAVVLKPGTMLTAGYIGFLATLGIAALRVHPVPKVGIIVTGKELVPAGQPLRPGQIYESNAVALQAALLQMGVAAVFAAHADDDEAELQRCIAEKISGVDVLLITGGISVGDYDFVKPVLEKLGAAEQFHKVKQKPGKPLYFGRLREKHVFALPGNPASVLTCFHVYVQPFLKALMGQPAFANKQYGILLNGYDKKAGLTHFVKARTEGHKVAILTGQPSFQMDAYTDANAYAVLRAEQEAFQVGEKVEIVVIA